VIEFCPQLQGRMHSVKRALSDSLVNRRNYLRRGGKMEKKQAKNDAVSRDQSLQSIPENPEAKNSKG